jgi:hypothetical protein
MSNIFVTNNSDTPLHDGYCGVFYDFKVGETLEIPVEAARHIFGYGDDDKQPYLARLGWARTSNDIPEGLKRLDQWSFSDSKPEKNQLLTPLVERVPLPSSRKAGGKVLSVAA